MVSHLTFIDKLNKSLIYRPPCLEFGNIIYLVTISLQNVSHPKNGLTVPGSQSINLMVVEFCKWGGYASEPFRSDVMRNIKSAVF